MTTLLRNLRLNRIDLVDKPANDEARVMLFKRDEMEDDAMADQSPTVDELKEQIRELTKRAEDAQAVAKANAEVEKRLAELDKRHKETETKLAEKTDELAKMREDNEVKSFIVKAAEYEGSFGPAGEFGPIYRKIHKTLNDEEREYFDEKLRSVTALVKQSAAFKEVGVGGETDPSDSWAKIERLAKTMVDKGNAKAADAVARVLETDEGKQLYTEYLKEQEKK